MRIFMTLFTTTGVYFITLLISAWAFTAVTGQPVDLVGGGQGIVMGVCLLLVPYLFNGFMCRKLFEAPVKGALISSLILVVGERLSIYLLGLFFVLNGGDGPFDTRPVMLFIQREAAPYFTLTYILLGVVSVAVSVLIASGNPPFPAKSH